MKLKQQQFPIAMGMGQDRNRRGLAATVSLVRRTLWSWVVASPTRFIVVKKWLQPNTWWLEKIIGPAGKDRRLRICEMIVQGGFSMSCYLGLYHPFFGSTLPLSQPHGLIDFPGNSKQAEVSWSFPLGLERIPIQMVGSGTPPAAWSFRTWGCFNGTAPKLSPPLWQRFCCWLISPWSLDSMCPNTIDIS